MHTPKIVQKMSITNVDTDSTRWLRARIIKVPKHFPTGDF